MTSKGNENTLKIRHITADWLGSTNMCGEFLVVYNQVSQITCITWSLKLKKYFESISHYHVKDC